MSRRPPCSPRWRWPTTTPSSSPCPRTSGCPEARSPRGPPAPGPEALRAARRRGTLGGNGAAPRGETMIKQLIPRMTEICGADGVLTDPAELRTYECDGLTSHRVTPALVVLPRTAEQVAAVVRECATAKVPFVARGSGTGLSGGALPRSDGVLIVTSRMRR